MQESVERGLATEGILPGGLNVRRRAPALARRLVERGSSDPLAVDGLGQRLGDGRQ